MGKVPAVDIYIRSNGGQSEAPWAMVQEIREFAEQFSVLVDSRALSAATHFALGADEIVMTGTAFLSPVDPFRQHPLLEKAPDGNSLAISVQDLKHAITFATTQYPGDELGDEAYAQIIVKLFDRVHPLAIGGIEQSYALAKRLSRQLLSTHMEDRDEVERIANTLSDDFKSHAYLIGRREAREIGLNVTDASAAVADGLYALNDYYRHATQFNVPVSTTTIPAAPFGRDATLQRIACVDSASGRWDACAVRDAAATGPLPTVWQHLS